MEITRNRIEKENDYRKLQSFGRTFRKDGHKLVLNAPEDELKARLLNIFDEFYNVSEPVPEVEEITDIVEEAITEVETEPEPLPEPKAKKQKADLYVARIGYKDWASKWSFTPGMDKPKALPKKLTQGLKNALANRIIMLYEE